MPETDIFAATSTIVGRTCAANESTPEERLHAVVVIADWARNHADAADMIDLYGLGDVVEAARDRLRGGIDA